MYWLSSIGKWFIYCICVILKSFFIVLMLPATAVALNLADSNMYCIKFSMSKCVEPIRVDQSLERKYSNHHFTLQTILWFWLNKKCFRITNSTHINKYDRRNDNHWLPVAGIRIIPTNVEHFPNKKNVARNCFWFVWKMPSFVRN